MSLLNKTIRTIGGNQEIPRYRRESITIEGNPLLGTTPLSLEGIPYYRRESLNIQRHITYYMRNSIII